MVMKCCVIDTLGETGILAVARIDQIEKAIPLANALLAGGVKVLEFSMNGVCCLDAISLVKKEMKGEIFVGASTVLDPESARSAILAGADFIVSPTTNFETIKMAHRYAKPVMPGAMTPSEILSAFENGADVIKLFPGGYLGAEYLRSIRTPFPQIPLMADGDINLNNAADLLRAGSFALGVGGSLIQKEKLAAGDWKGISDTANKFVEIVRESHGA